MWVAEFTNQVACSPTTVRKKIPHITMVQPPRASRITAKIVMGAQCHLMMKV